MAQYRICRTFTVESGHMLSRHPEGCRFPHGHTRVVEVVLSGEKLDENGMLVDFKALNLALSEYIDKYDHALAVNSADPALDELAARYPAEALVIFQDQEPTTEAIAKDIYDYVSCVFRDGFSVVSENGIRYEIRPGSAKLERVRVSETPSSWAEFGE